MKNKSDVTIKELADELGITKQAVRRYFEQLPIELVPTKKGGSYKINLEAQRFIRDKVNRVDTKLDSKVDTNKKDIDIKIDSKVGTNVDSKNEDNYLKFRKSLFRIKMNKSILLKNKLKRYIRY